MSQNHNDFINVEKRKRFLENEKRTKVLCIPDDKIFVLGFHSNSSSGKIQTFKFTEIKDQQLFKFCLSKQQKSSPTSAPVNLYTIPPFSRIVRFFSIRAAERPPRPRPPTSPRRFLPAQTFPHCEGSFCGSCLLQLENSNCCSSLPAEGITQQGGRSGQGTLG